MDNSKKILGRLRHVFGVKTNTDLAGKLGVSYNTLNTWIKRDTIPMDIITKIVHERQLSFDWLLLGIEEREESDRAVTDSADIYSIPILSIRAAAGSAGNILSEIDRFDTSQKIQVDKVLFKTPPKGTVRAVQIDGHSMIPMLYPDAWVLFDETSEYSGDGLYVINWQDILMVKLLQVDFATGLLHIKSANPEYQSWEVDPSSQEVFRIVGRVLRTIV